MRRLALILALSLAPVLASAQCDITKTDPICNFAAFKQAFTSAPNVTFNNADLDPIAAKQLGEFLTSFHKQILSDSDHPALVFVLTHPDTNGIFVGPSGVVIARLRIYSPGGRALLWEETYQDQPDVPWPSAVLYLLQSLRTRLTKP